MLDAIFVNQQQCCHDISYLQMRMTTFRKSSSYLSYTFFKTNDLYKKHKD